MGEKKNDIIIDSRTISSYLLSDIKYIDMHCHTTFSDGEYSAEQLLNMAINNGVGIMSFTDHDTVKAYQSLNYNSVPFRLGLQLIPGVELTASVNHGRMHILGYDIDVDNNYLNSFIRVSHLNSCDSFLHIINFLYHKFDIVFPRDEIDNLIDSGKNIGRTDIALLLIKYNYVGTVEDAFKQFLIEAYEETRYLKKVITDHECIKVIKDAGGYAILAHPKSLLLTYPDLEDKLKILKSYGLDGIEVYHSYATPYEQEILESIANKFDFLISGGSDFHGPVLKPEIEFRSGINNNVLIRKLSLTDKIYMDRNK